MDVALVTAAALPGLVADDRHLLRALLERGVAAEPVVWEDPYTDWSAYRLCVIRSAWDYAYRRDAFLSWARRAAAASRLWNPLSVVEWNTHKRYLVDLAARGVRVVPTVLLAAGERVALSDELEARGWEQAVVKAAVAQSGRYIRHVTRATVDAVQAHLDRLQPHEDMLLQPFIPTVREHGELSLVFIEGECTHAVRKHAAGADFRVHDDYGGSVALETPGAAELATARAALDAMREPLMYARVDVVRAPDGDAMVMEFEVVEPELFFRCSTEATRKMADAIARTI